MSAVNSLPNAKEVLQKKITEYTQFQWLALMPCWLSGVLTAVNRTPTVPGREGYVLAFRLGMFVLGIVCFTAMRIKIGKMKAELASLENPPLEVEQRPPIPAP
jgi:hypothetical protein